MISRWLSCVLILIGLTACTKDIAKLPPETKEVKDAKKEKKAPGQAPLVAPVSEGFETAATPAKAQDNLVGLNKVTATVMGLRTSQLSFRINGYLDSVLVKNGQMVKKGQVLAKLDNSLQTEQLKLAKYALEQAKVNAYYADLALKRAQTLMAKQASTQVVLEQAQSSAKTTTLAVQQAEAQLKLQQINYDETTLVAPFEGYVFNLTAWVGSYISSTAPVLFLTSLADLQIQIPIPQTRENKFKVGQKFSFSNPVQNHSGSLVVTGIVPFVDPVTKTYLVFATPEKVDGGDQLMAGELILVDLE